MPVVVASRAAHVVTTSVAGPMAADEMPTLTGAVVPAKHVHPSLKKRGAGQDRDSN